MWWRQCVLSYIFFKVFKSTYLQLYVLVQNSTDLVQILRRMATDDGLARADGGAGQTRGQTPDLRASVWQSTGADGHV